MNNWSTEKNLENILELRKLTYDNKLRNTNLPFLQRQQQLRF